MNFEQIIPELKAKLTDGPERVGFILENGEIIEVRNVCHEADDGFEVAGHDLVKYQHAVGTWHTHPGVKSRLSSNDFFGFRNYPEWTHIIVGTDGVTSYRVDKGRVLIDKQWIDES